MEIDITQQDMFSLYILTRHSSKGKGVKMQVHNLLCLSVFVSVWFQAPTERQLRYKEKVTELRRKRNSSLNKEQKEKHMVSGWEMNGFTILSGGIHILYCSKSANTKL